VCVAGPGCSACGGDVDDALSDDLLHTWAGPVSCSICALVVSFAHDAGGLRVERAIFSNGTMSAVMSGPPPDLQCLLSSITSRAQRHKAAHAETRGWNELLELLPVVKRRHDAIQVCAICSSMVRYSAFGVRRARSRHSIAFASCALALRERLALAALALHPILLAGTGDDMGQRRTGSRAGQEVGAAGPASANAVVVSSPASRLDSF